MLFRSIEAGELTVKNGEAREIYNVDTENVKDSGKTFLQVLGVRIELENADEKFLASCWTDNTAAVIGKPIKVQADLSNKENPVSTPKPEPFFTVSSPASIAASASYIRYTLPFPEYFPRFFICTRNALFSPFISTFIKPALFPFILPSYKYRYVTNLFMLIYPPARFVLFYE